MLDYKKVEKELLKRAGYREKNLLTASNSKEITKIQEGLYEFRKIFFAYNMFGYEDYTIVG
ncbi:hypothetical protein [Thermoanaerobacter sp. RKWS2]|uniref:hypothetical protein n=1 Tax=Thermoanaerobacter sp. RKWS2 TaxID=2983842 RepID=UPI00224A94E1|nr:hypothetical protein [Thermoanaerobacter sp. RKWS2]UZQ81769.1 hypothetical protein OEI98_001506 [Thermoanaerobacter sp. RKWS2]